MEGQIDYRLTSALRVALAWEKNEASVGDARNASLDAIAAANEVTSPVDEAVARAVGHAVATAHMADHSLGTAVYALIAVKKAGLSIDSERNWQNEQLPSEIRDLVLTNRGMKEQAFKELK